MKALIVVLASLTLASTASASTSVCASPHIYFSTWQSSGGPMPMVGMVVRESTLVLSGKPVEELQYKYQTPEPQQLFDKHFDETTKRVIESAGTIGAGHAIYEIKMTVSPTAAAPQGTPAQAVDETVLCRDDWFLAP